MARFASHRFGRCVIAAVLVASVLTFGTLAGGMSLRHAAASQGCDNINNSVDEFGGFMSFLMGQFVAGDTVSVTVGQTISGTPTSLGIDGILSPSLQRVGLASGPVPGPVTYALTGTDIFTYAFLEFTVNNVNTSLHV